LLDPEGVRPARIGQVNPTVTLAVYAHVFAGANRDEAAAKAIEATMGAKR
jgi:hypothetical protein